MGQLSKRINQGKNNNAIKDNHPVLDPHASGLKTIRQNEVEICYLYPCDCGFLKLISVLTQLNTINLELFLVYIVVKNLCLTIWVC